jgi:antirestriction protein ArdC
MNTSTALYETVTQRIIEELEQGAAPWVRPWTAGTCGDLPYNAVSQRTYRGVNVLLLWMAGAARSYCSPAWLTFRQAGRLGGRVRKGEKAEHIVYTATFIRKETDEATGEETEQTVSFLRGYTVFNLEQVEGLPARLYQMVEPKLLEEALAHVETFLRVLGADLRHGGDRAFYSPGGDFIRLPEPGDFESAGHYYATSLHEHGHWSAHPSRLDRDLSGRFGSEAYAAEELVAELTAAFLCAYLAIPGRLRHAEYLGAWLKLLREDKRAIFTAAAKATQAAEYLRLLAEPEKPLRGEEMPEPHGTED